MGENVGNGFSLMAVYNAFVASPDHHANMVDKTFNHTGVGVATDSRGQVWVRRGLRGLSPADAVPPWCSRPPTATGSFSSSQAFSWSMTPGTT